MAHSAGSGPSTHGLSVAPPTSIPKEVQGVENPVPLSPQWLLPKTGDVKLGTSPGGIYSTPGNLSGSKLSGDGSLPKKDVFRPSLADIETGNRDRWRDEERDTNSLLRRDRWRDGDREHGETRRVERLDNTARSFGDTRRAPSERRTDLFNRENNNDNWRESKWNTRWGPDDSKDREGSHEKFSNSVKDGEILVDKGLINSSNPIKDEREGDNYRPWRGNFLQSRARGEPPLQQSLIVNKHDTALAPGRRWGENVSKTFSAGRGRGNSVGSQAYGTSMYSVEASSEKSDIGHGEPSTVKYSRMKLLGIFRTMEVKYHKNLKDGLVQVPSLTLEEPVEPYALCAPSVEETDVLDGIDSGHIVSSGAQIPKDGSLGRNTSDNSLSRRNRFASTEELPFPVEESGTEHVETSKGLSINSIETLPPEHNIDQNRNVKVYLKDEDKWCRKDDSTLERQSAGFMNRVQDERGFLHSNPENLILYYKDPQGEIQGPFTGSDIIGWFEAGFFGIDLLVRPSGAHSGSPFMFLGDVMPHLRAKARPPPGFRTPKPNEVDGPLGRSDLSSSSNIYAGFGGTDLIGNDLRRNQTSTKEAENRFLESLMSGSGSSMPSEGLQTQREKFSIGEPTSEVDGGNALLMAKRIELERQLSMSNLNQYWGRDPVTPSPNVVPNSITHSSLLSAMPDGTRLPQAQHPDLMSLLQGLTERPFLPIQDQMSLHHSQNFSSPALLGLQQQRLQTQSQPSFTNMFPQLLDNISNLSPDKLLSSGLLEDPRFLTLLQEQQLMWLHPQVQASAQQLSLLDKVLLLQQQQKHEQQQQLLRQQQLMSQILSNHPPNQRFVEPSFGPSQMGTAPVDPQLKLSQELLHPGMNDLTSSNTINLPPQVNQNIGVSATTEASLQLPHQIFVSLSNQMNLSDPIHEPSETIQKEPFTLSKTVEKPSTLDVLVKSLTEGHDPLVAHPPKYPIPQLGSSAADPDKTTLSELTADAATLESPVVDDSSTEACENKFPAHEHSDALKVRHDVALDKLPTEVSGMEEPVASDASLVENCGIKKVPEKKSRKQKSSKSSSALEQAKGMKAGASPQSSQPDILKNPLSKRVVESADNFLEPREGGSSLQENTPGDSKLDREKVKVDSSQNSISVPDSQPGPRAWRAAPGSRAKSLLEIQQEEERKAQMEMAVSEVTTSVSSMNMSTSWTGVLNSDNKTSRDIVGDTGGIAFSLGRNESFSGSLSQKSQLQDIFLEEAVPKTSQTQLEISAHVTNALSVEDDDFIEAKDNKKSRKRSTKGKNVISKASLPITSDIPAAPIPFEKVKSSRAVQEVKEVPQTIPSGPSLGDFVPWKVESSNPSTAAWSNSGKVAKPATSLRDILKEQEKVSSISIHDMPTPQKSQSVQAVHKGSSWLPSGASATKATSPIQMNSIASSQLKHKVDDDLFWGPVDQSREEEKKVAFPELGNQGGWVTKSTPVKGTVGGSLSRQKSAGTKLADRPLSSSPSQSSLKGKRDAMNRHSEAMDFRDWCQSECNRLIGTTDTSFLEFCLKQSRSEAEMLLKENLGSYDTNHEFIDKFLNYKELLPAEVLEIAFESSSDRKVTCFNVSEKSNNMGSGGDIEREFTDGTDSKGGGKKKGKKGKKVMSPSVLGFNVVSNRIMMGEIQTIED
ncbi:hypothetical protein SAY87_004449 [Trapa incisa]|uniref:GYF domain-containing protein n=1 Tax=Trapa incisa TaxID=236973 RepID=A0AAN7JPQ5_9MYRT|nr:hypothetical protein SAY87_004449 [Trapa incisa]